MYELEKYFAICNLKNLVYNDVEGGIFMNNKVKCALALGAFIILSILGYFMLPKDEVVIKESNDVEEEYIFVHIEGCVNKPGLIKVKYGTRVYELIEQAGGETENADLSRVNLASIVTDEQKVIIPAKVVISEDSEEDSAIVNINTASKEKLITLTGVGESTAEKIIKYREENGYFNTIEDLMNVPGIGKSKFDSLKDDITV